MNREQIIQEIYKSGLIQKYTNYFKSYHKNYDDFSQHLFLILCEIPEDKLIKMYEAKELSFYMFYIAKSQATNKKSDYNKLINGRIEIDKNIDVTILNESE